MGKQERSDAGRLVLSSTQTFLSSSTSPSHLHSHPTLKANQAVADGFI